MARPTPDEVQKEIKQAEDDFYGDETYAGSNPSGEVKNSDEMLEDVIGNKPDEDEAFSIADEVNGDELSLLGSSKKPRSISLDGDGFEEEEEEEGEEEED
jgi:hypothetical protein